MDSKGNNPPQGFTPELIRVDLGTVVMSRADRAFIWGAVQERVNEAKAHGEHYDWPDFVREALLEAAQA